MVYAHVKDGRVENTIVADEEFIAAHGAQLAQGGAWVKLDDSTRVSGQLPGPGWLYNAGTRRFSRP